MAVLEDKSGVNNRRVSRRLNMQLYPCLMDHEISSAGLEEEACVLQAGTFKVG